MATLPSKRVVVFVALTIEAEYLRLSEEEPRSKAAAGKRRARRGEKTADRAGAQGGGDGGNSLALP